MSNNLPGATREIPLHRALRADCDGRGYLLSIVGAKDPLASPERLLFFVVGILHLVSRTFSFLTSLFVSQLRFLLLQEARVVISARFLRDVDRGPYSGSS